MAANVRVYQAASLGAAGATNIFTYALHSASAAIKGFLASIPAVGWVLLALSVAVGGGVALWSKYSASVRAANEDYPKIGARGIYEKAGRSAAGSG